MKTPRKSRYLLLLLLPLLVAVGVKSWYSSALAATGESEKSVIVAEGSSTEQIANLLKKEKLIKSERAFRWHARSAKLDDKFKSGKFVLKGSEATPAIAQKLTEAPQINRITIKEGQTQDEIAAQLDALNVASKSEFASLKASAFDYDFLKDAPRSATLEGFLFPDTYELPTANVEASALADIFLKEFDNKLSAELRQRIAANQATIFDTVIVASLLEKEVRSDQDRKLVAGIIYRRLREDIRLDIDATVNYALDIPYTQPLTADDLASDNPYNTRRVKGLPPGPISNPSLSSLVAAANPQASDFLYYLSDPKTGRTIFAETLDEHNANVQQYLR